MTYELRVNTINHTEDSIRIADIVTAHGSKEGFLNELYPKIEAQLKEQVINGFSEHGFSVRVENFTFQPAWEDKTIFFVDRYIEITRLSLNIDYSIYSEVPIHQSPLPIWVMPLIGLALKWAVIAILGYFAIQAIKDFLIGLTTTITETWTYDEEGDLLEHTKKTEPNPLGEGMFWIFGIIAFVIVLFWVMGKPNGGE